MKIDIKNKLILAPMAGYSDQAFRRLCFEHGADIAYSEMVSAKALHYNDWKTKELLFVAKDEPKVAIQIFGSELEPLKNAVLYLNDDDRVDIIDFNLGCPAPKIVKNNEGAALLKDLSKVYSLVKGMKEVSKKSLSVKMRIGIDGNNNYLETAKILEDAGADFVIVHGRTREMYYSGETNWEAIGEIKNALHIPVVGNGDIVTPEDAKKAYDTYKVDALMIGRGCVGRPYLFSEIKEYLATGSYGTTSLKEHFEILIKHIDLECELKGENVGIREMRKFIHAYIKGMDNSAVIKNKVNSITDVQVLKEYLFDYMEQLLTLED